MPYHLGNDGKCNVVGVRNEQSFKYDRIGAGIVRGFLFDIWMIGDVVVDVYSFYKKMRALKEVGCLHCRQTMKPKRRRKGSLIAEVTLWLIGILGILFLPRFIVLPLIFFPLFIVPPIFYSGWRLLSKRVILCSNCGLKICEV